MKKIVLIVFVIQCFCLSQSWGQKETQHENHQSIKKVSESDSLTKSKKNKTIQGKIIDEAGVPISGANILITGTSIGTISNLNGEFLIDIKLLSICYYLPLHFFNSTFVSADSTPLSCHLKCFKVGCNCNFNSITK